MEHNSVEQMLHYAVEMLGKDAYQILSRVGNIIDLKDTTNLRFFSYYCTFSVITILLIDYFRPEGHQKPQVFHRLPFQ